MRRLSLILLTAVVGGCAGAAPGSTEASASAATASSGPTVLTASPSVAVPSIEAPLTDHEIDSLTSGGLVAIPENAPPATVNAAAAEMIVRTTYLGQRVTIEVRRIAIQSSSRIRVGWLVALSPMAGAPCANHAGLLPRAIEGGIVDDQTGDMFWLMTCG